MKVLLLAAGFATRMYPLTRDRPKPLLDVGGRPLLAWILERALAVGGVGEVVVISNGRFAAQFERWAEALDVSVPVRVLNDGSREASGRLGALGDLAFALDAAPLAGDDWLVLAGDSLIGFELAPAAREFRRRGRPLVLVRRLAPDADASPYNRVELGDDQRIVRFREKPAGARGGLAAMAAYFFPASTEISLRRYLREGGEPDAPGHFLEWLVEHEPVFAFEPGGRWLDVGSLEGLERADRWVRDEELA